MTESPNEGLNPLDEDRARSMADEGGAAAATVEAATAVSYEASVVWFGALLSVLATTLVVLWRRRSRI
jgi:hypothetical protein